MKLVSWNINGIRSAEKELLEFIGSFAPDVLLLQEVKAHPNDLSFFLKMISGYGVEFNPSQRPGYSGTAIYYKETLPLSSLAIRVGNEILDAEGRTILVKIGKTHLLNFYTPNGTSGEERLEFKLKFYEEVKRFVTGQLSAGDSVVVGGDLNVAHTELDLFAPSDNANHSGFLLSERKWFDDLERLGLVDTFRLFQKEGGHYSWWHMRDPKRELNRGWRFDYFLVSKDLVPKVSGAKILRDVYGSDHCPILLEIDI